MEKKGPITVFIVDDSKVARDLLAHIIEKDPELKVVGFANDGEEALSWLKIQPVDVVTMDIHMPVIDGFEVTRRIMETNPIPIVIVSAGYAETQQDLVFRSLEAGALSILEKPNMASTDFVQKSEEIITTIKTIAGIKLITRKTNKLTDKKTLKPREIASKEVRAIAIGASLGGPQAIAEVLSNLSPSISVPIFIVQHIANGFTASFVRWLQDQTQLKVCVAQNGEKASAGCVYVAPDRCQMEIIGDGLITLDTKTSSETLQPSVARLFKSIANTYGSFAVGVLLTGMGKDGAEELLLMRQKGAYTIAQDEESCVVYGMPGAAVARGAAQQILPLDEIANVLNSLVK